MKLQNLIKYQNILFEPPQNLAAEAYDYWSTATQGKAMVVVSFDDVWATDYTTVYPLFKARGLKGTSYIVPSFIGQPGRLTWEQIHLMRNGA